MFIFLLVGLFNWFVDTLIEKSGVFNP